MKGILKNLKDGHTRWIFRPFGLKNIIAFMYDLE